MLRRLLLCFLCLIAIFAFIHPSRATAQPRKLRVAMVLSGPITDKGFNQSGYDALTLLKDKLGADIVYSESTPTANFERVVRGFADDGNDVIIGHGFEYTDVMQKVSKDYPRQYFLITESPGVSGPNIASIEPTNKDAAFLVGALAGLTTKSNKVGAVIGFDFPTLVAQVEAFRLGMKSVNPKAELSPVYIGTFDDPAKGKEAALAQISAGADVIYHIVDAASIGVIQAADEKGVKAIGWGIDQNSIAPKTVIATQVSDTGAMLLTEVQTIANGTFDGKAKEFGLDTPVIGVSDYHGLVTDDVAAQVAQWKQAIISGGVQVPFITDKDGAVKLDPLPLKMSSATPAATDSAITQATAAQ